MFDLRLYKDLSLCINKQHVWWLSCALAVRHDLKKLTYKIREEEILGTKRESKLHFVKSNDNGDKELKER